MTELRSLPVPEGLVGMRVDAAVAKLCGISRSLAAELAAEGSVRVDHSPAGKSQRLASGSWLEVELPDPNAKVTAAPERVAGMDILYSDADVIAVNKPVGVAAHPTALVRALG